MAGQVPGADCVQRAAGQQVMAWLPGVGGDAGGERWRRWPGAVRGEVLAEAPGGSQPRPGGPAQAWGGGTRGGAGGGAAGGWLKEAEINAPNSASTHCWSAYTRSTNAASVSRVLLAMPITLPTT